MYLYYIFFLICFPTDVLAIRTLSGPPVPGLPVPTIAGPLTVSPEESACPKKRDAAVILVGKVRKFWLETNCSKLNKISI